MRTRDRLAAVAGVVALAWAVSAAAPDQPPAAAPKPPPPAAPTVTKVSGPYTHANLAVFLLHGPDAMPGRTFLTLQEALEQKKVIVHETSEVNELSVENVSDGEVFIQNGDIVKGGKQDRLIAFDLVVPAKSGKLPIPSYCVESGRWTKRGGEDDGKFSESKSQAAKSLKLAFNESRRQDRVWTEVRTAQQKLSMNVGKPVAAGASPSSYELTLEDKDLLEKLGQYEKALADVLKDKTDVVGVAFAVNGKLESAEVYGSPALCGKLWPKLLRAGAVDALADLKKDAKFEPASAKAVETFLTAATDGQAKELAVVSAVPSRGGRSGRGIANNESGQPEPTARPAQQPTQQAGAVPRQQDQPAQPPAATTPPRVRILQIDSIKNLVVESQDREKPGILIHRSYIAK